MEKKRKKGEKEDGGREERISVIKGIEVFTLSALVFLLCIWMWMSSFQAPNPFSYNRKYISKNIFLFIFQKKEGLFKVLCPGWPMNFISGVKITPVGGAAWSLVLERVLLVPFWPAEMNPLIALQCLWCIGERKLT